MSDLARAIREIVNAAFASGTTDIGLDAILEALVARGFGQVTMGEVRGALGAARQSLSGSKG